MKKILMFVLVAVSMLLSVFGLVACGGDNPAGSNGSGTDGHEHAFSQEWSYDDEYHWHAAVCEHTAMKLNYEKHNYGDTNVCVCGKVNHQLDEGYKVTFVAEGTIVAVRTYTEDNRVVSEPEVPVKVGYNGSWENYNLNDTDITVYAYYTPKTYTVALDYKGGTERASSITVTYDQVVDGLPQSSKNEFIFDGWRCGRTLIDNGDVWKTDGENLTISVKWVSEYISFEENDGCYFVKNITKRDLQSLEIPDYFRKKPVVKVLYDLSNCSDLTELLVPDSLTEIAGLPSNSGMKYNEYENGQYFGNEYNPYVIFACGKLGTGSGKLHEDTKIIGGAAFRQWQNSITEISLPDGVVSLCDRAFTGCNLLKSVTLPTSIVYIDENAFLSTNSLENIVVDENNTVYASHDGILFDKNKTQIKYVPKAVKGNIEIPNGVLKICNDAFNGCKFVTGVTMPDSVIAIEHHAFYECTALSDLTIGDKVADIGYSAFSKCSALTRVNIPASVTSFGDYVFSNCASLTNMTVAANNKKYYSANNCIIEKDSKTLVFGCNGSAIPADGSVASIGASAFSGCLFTSITIPFSVTRIADNAFGDCNLLETVTISEGVNVIGNSAFYHCDALSEVSVPTSVQSIEQQAFGMCVALYRINYAGYISQWDSVEKYKDTHVTTFNWDYNTGNYMVYCCDGNVNKK